MALHTLYCFKPFHLKELAVHYHETKERQEPKEQQQLLQLKPNPGLSLLNAQPFVLPASRYCITGGGGLEVILMCVCVVCVFVCVGGGLYQTYQHGGISLPQEKASVSLPANTPPTPSSAPQWEGASGASIPSRKQVAARPM